MIIGIHHIAISVDNIEEAVTFYTTAFSFQPVQQENIDNDVLANRVSGKGHAVSPHPADRSFHVFNLQCHMRVTAVAGP